MRIIVLLAVAACTASPRVRPETPSRSTASCDQSTPQGILAALAANEVQLDRCDARATSLDGLTVVEHFGHDYGCHADMVLVQCTVMDPDEDAQLALTALGWEHGDRARLALAYTTEVLFSPDAVLLEQPRRWTDRKGAPAFTAPTATPQAGGGVEVTFWEQTHPGVSSAGSPDFNRFRVTFAPDGTPLGIERTLSF
jgi:hypothetical protein